MDESRPRADTRECLLTFFTAAKLKAKDANKYTELCVTHDFDVEGLIDLSIEELVSDLGMSKGIARKVYKHAHASEAAIAGRTVAAPPPGAPQGPIQIGSTLGGGKYEITGRVEEQGGMSTVFKARDTLLDRPVCVKFVKEPPGRERDDAIARLRREAQYAAGMQHPNLLEIFDVVPDDGGRAYMVSELIGGTTLQRMIDAKDIQLNDPANVAHIGLGLLRALQAVHGAGIVHRDVKPANVMVSNTDCSAVHFIDFDTSGCNYRGCGVGAPQCLA